MSEWPWCECGLASNDPQHDGWHKLYDWNLRAFEAARARRQAEFDKHLAEQERRRPTTTTAPQEALGMDVERKRHSATLT